MDNTSNILDSIDSNKKPKTLYDKLWDMHTVHVNEDGTTLIYIDRQLLHEVTSPQAFEGLTNAHRKIWRKQANIAVADHNVPTNNRHLGIIDATSKTQIDALSTNCNQYNILLFGMQDKRQGIVHVMAPEQGVTLPGMTIVCGDSHTSTHGAFGAMAFGIGTSEVEHVLATQTLMLKKAKNMKIQVSGKLPKYCSAKDIALAIIGKIGTAGGTGYTIEFYGQAISDLSIEGRMTLCNMAIEAGARTGIVAVDEKTIQYFMNKPFSPSGKELQQAIEFWQTLISDDKAEFDKIIEINVSNLNPQVTWGTSPEMVVDINQTVPQPQNSDMQKALDYMGLQAGQAIQEIKIDKVFIGSCTNSRIEDLREAAYIIKSIGGKIASNIKLAMIVPGSGLVKQQAEQEGLHNVFINAGFEWRDAGCSMCLAMNADKLEPFERCASTSNRNFEGRQGAKGRTHLVSPAMAAASALKGKFTDITSYY